MIKRLIFGSIVSMSLSAHALDVFLSNDEVFQGDSLSLTITDTKPINEVDFSPLTKDFMVAGQQRGQSSQFINGVGSTTYELSVVLLPIKSGKIEIPVLKVGDESTRPLTLQVQQQTEQNATVQEDTIQLSAKLSSDTAYEGESVFYTLQLKDNVGILNGEILPGSSDNVVLAQMGQDKEKTSVHNGQPLRIVERIYRLTPQKGGQIEIQPALFNGEIAYQQKQRPSHTRLFGLFDANTLFSDLMMTTRPVQIMSNVLHLDVKEKPSDWSGWWLPSSHVELSVEYSPTENVKVGDTIHGEITLTAIDVDADDMPLPKLSINNDFRLYPEPEERFTDMKDNGHFMGVVKSKFSIMPLVDGKIEIPAIQIPWFNVQTHKTEIANIDSFPLVVAPGVAPVSHLINKKEDPKPQVEKFDNPPEDHFVSGILLGALVSAVLFLGIFLIFILRKHTPKKQEKKKPIPDFYPF